MHQNLAFAGALAARIAGACVFTALSAQAATEDNFRVKTTSDYLALCSAEPGSDDYVAAIHFCQGFASGAYQYYLALALHEPAERFVCLPTPAPSRNTVKAGFIAWTQANPDALDQPPVASLFRYLAQTYPCMTDKRASN